MSAYSLVAVFSAVNHPRRWPYSWPRCSTSLHNPCLGAQLILFGPMLYLVIRIFTLTSVDPKVDVPSNNDIEKKDTVRGCAQIFAFHQDFDFGDSHLRVIQTSESTLSLVENSMSRSKGCKNSLMHKIYLIVELGNNNRGGMLGHPPWLAHRPGAADQTSSDICSLLSRAEVKLSISDTTCRYACECQCAMKR